MRILICASLAAFATAAWPAASLPLGTVEPPGAQTQVSRERYVSVSRFIGAPVLDPFDLLAGGVRDLFVEWPQGDARYVEISVSASAILTVLPLNDLRPYIGRRALSIDESAWPVDIRSASAGSSAHVLAGTRRSSSLMAAVVTDSDGGTVGVVDDLVVDLPAQRLTWVVVRFMPGVLRFNRLLSFDPSSFEATGLQEPLRLRLTSAELAGRDGYVPREWEGRNDPEGWINSPPE